MLTIIDYKAGNVRSIQNMLKKIGVKSIISNKIESIEAADKLILPGVGSFNYGMEQLENSGLIPVLNKKVLDEKTPILGICLGMQLFTKGSEEGNKKGLAWLDAETIAFNKKLLPENYKIPNMGWNEVEYNKESKLFKNMYEIPSRFYFVHSYHVKTGNAENILATTTYGYTFTVGLEKDNIVGVQFHPEKSHKFGMQILRNFIENY
ncbi:MAG: imidazole glycerol phosphate synthase subunit HisH [Bacteroidales bacterium]|nr:imidazole glycerol phosphate synthase subunit HisH [Bacteroidales bacterium]MBN2757793.1 imidazole glycerol phosphate synthase subunit HisH [Bacteroidales bacterium]